VFRDRLPSLRTVGRVAAAGAVLWLCAGMKGSFAQPGTGPGDRVLLTSTIAWELIGTPEGPPLPAPPAPEPRQFCGGRCLNPHPGQFQQWVGGTAPGNTCVVQIWRRWPEGCTHWQWFNKCNNIWDADQFGNARVNWTCCVH
jgi:hypothetical protein